MTLKMHDFGDKNEVKTWFCGAFGTVNGLFD
jgi:hypothetical protein